MKKIINTLGFILITLSVAFLAQSCSGSATNSSKSEAKAEVVSQETGEIKVYYFHASRRCATCEAVEAVAVEAIKEHYGDKVAFESVDNEEEKNNPLLKKYDISGQTFIIVNGGIMVDLTNEAFLNARTNPDKFKSKIKSTIDSML